MAVRSAGASSARPASSAGSRISGGGEERAGRLPSGYACAGPAERPRGCRRRDARSASGAGMASSMEVSEVGRAWECAGRAARAGDSRAGVSGPAPERAAPPRDGAEPGSRRAQAGTVLAGARPRGRGRLRADRRSRRGRGFAPPTRRRNASCKPMRRTAGSSACRPPSCDDLPAGVVQGRGDARGIAGPGFGDDERIRVPVEPGRQGVERCSPATPCGPSTTRAVDDRGGVRPCTPRPRRGGCPRRRSTSR